MASQPHQELTQAIAALEGATLATVRLFLAHAPGVDRGTRAHVPRVPRLDVNVALLCNLRSPCEAVEALCSLLRGLGPMPRDRGRTRVSRRRSA